MTINFIPNDPKSQADLPMREQPARPDRPASRAEAVHRREVPLGQFHKELRGVVAYAAEPVLVGASGPRAALLGALPEPNRTEDEVAAFVETLVKNNRILYGKKVAPKGARAAAARRRSAVAASASTDVPTPYTHVIKSVGGKKVLTRVRFLCGCCR